jgi:hypothetical protein
MAQRVRLGLCHAKYLGFSLASWISCCLRRWWTRSRCRAGLGTRSNFPKIRLVAGSLLSTPGTRTTRCLVRNISLEVFKDAEMVVWPSGACGSMVRDSYPELLAASSYESSTATRSRASFSGSSRTADIEKILAQGAAGPRRLVVVGQTGTQASGGLAIRLYQLANINQPIFSQCVPRSHLPDNRNRANSVY